MEESKKTVLFVEDGADNSAEILLSLNDAGYNTIHFTEGQRMVDFIVAAYIKTDLVIMDVSLRNKSDILEIAHILSHVKNIPIIISGEDAGFFADERFKEIICYGYIGKNISKKLLCAIIENSIRLHNKKSPALYYNDTLNLRLLLENLNELICEVDNLGIFCFASFSYYKTLGYRPSELIGQQAIEFVHPEDIISATVKYNAILRHGSTSKDRWRIRHKNGSYRWFECSSFFYEKSPGILRAVVISKDVTDKVNDELALKESAERFRNLLDKVANIAVQGYAPDGTVIYWNKASERLYGYSAGEAMGKNLVDLIIPPQMREMVRKDILKMIENGEGNPPEELFLMKKDGSLFPVYSNHTVINIPGHDKELFCIDIDLTERKNAELQKEKYAEELKLLNSTKDKFISILAHDLRGPFQGFLGVSEYLSSESDSIPRDEIKRMSSELNSSLQRQYELLNDLLSWTRLQSGSFVLKPQQLLLNDVIKNVLGALELNAKQKDISIAYEDDNTLKVFTDLAMLSTVLRNLISNSIKFTNRNGMVSIFMIPSENFVEVFVKDNGIGIAEDDLDKLFKMDFKYTTEGTENEKGSGLGLIICKEIIEKHKGILKVKSKINEGTTFSFTLPMVDIF